MVHTIVFSTRTGRVLYVVSESDEERADLDSAISNLRLRKGEAAAAVRFDFPATKLRIHEWQRIASEQSGKVPLHLHESVRAHVMASSKAHGFEVVNDLYEQIDQHGKRVNLHYADPEIEGAKCPDSHLGHTWRLA